MEVNLNLCKAEIFSSIYLLLVSVTGWYFIKRPMHCSPFSDVLYVPI
jgi:hypothetical protein